MNNENNNLTFCPHCESEFECYEANFCPFCGESVFNYCTNKDCDMCPSNINYEEDWALKPNYKFCPYCGSKSTFYDCLSKSKEDNFSS